jgi:hypothetical protein
MDRRQVLLGITAMGLAGPFNLGELLNAQSIEADSPVSRDKQEHLTARERDGLRGPVKTCVEDAPIYQGRSVTTKEYGLEGKLLSFRSEMDGQPSFSFSDSDWLETDVRDSQGRLVKKVYGRRGEPLGETLYSYDDAGRLQASTTSEHSRIEFHYQPDGSKISVQTFDPKTIERTRGGASADSDWDGAYGGFGVPMGGNVTMIYDSNDRPTEMQIRSADGQLVTRILRTYDAQGRLIQEKPVVRNLGLLMLDRMPPEKRAALSPDQMKELSEFFDALGKTETGTTFTYDDQGRVTHTRERNILEDKTTSILYNERGDKIRERTTFKNNSVVPIGVPSSSSPEYEDPSLSQKRMKGARPVSFRYSLRLFHKPVVFLQCFAQALVRNSDDGVAVDTGHRLGRHHRVHHGLFGRLHGCQKDRIQRVVRQHGERMQSLGADGAGIGGGEGDKDVAGAVTGIAAIAA